MVISFISAKEIIARINHDLTIDHSDWIPSAPLWLADGLAQLNSSAVWEDAWEEVEIAEYKGTLPCNIKVLRALDYNGERMVINGKIPSPFYDRTTLFTSKYTYEIYADRNIVTSLEEGIITVLFKRPAVEYWEEHNVYIPRIPDDPFVIEALKWFLMTRLLQKGTKHPIFNLKENNPYTNPAIAWENFSKKARNSISMLSPDQRIEASKLFRTFITNLNYFDNIQYPTLTNIAYNDIDYPGII